MPSHCSCSSPVDPKSIPSYSPTCCVHSANTDPRRNTAYCPPTPSRSEPMSHAAYLRRLKANNNGALSSTNNLVVGTGSYQQTIWSASSPSCCTAGNVLPAVPAVHPGGHALDSGIKTKMDGDVAARGTTSRYDNVNHTEGITTRRREGMAVINDPTYNAPAGSLRPLCANCLLAGTSSNPSCPCR